MIETIEIKNFRGFRHLKMTGCKLVNVIVGDNAAGKTALLEAVFLAGASSPQHAFNLRGWRGFDASVQGEAREVERALWGQFFTDFDSSRSIEITLTGNAGDTRSVILSREDAPVSLPLEGATDSERHDTQIRFEWRGPGSRSGIGKARIVDGRIEIAGIPDSTLQTVFFPATAPIAARDAAQRFSRLSKVNAEGALVEEIRKLFPTIATVSVELEAGVPMLFVGIEGAAEKMPVNLVSAGTNRIAAMLLAIAASPGGAVIVDEIDNGIFHSRMTPLWRSMLALGARYQTQIFATTHDLECLMALVAASEDPKDIGFWRLQRSKNGCAEIVAVGGKDLKAGLEYGSEVR